MSLTSLIDVIFLLLLFFMLSSTFSRFAEVELTAGSAGTGESSSSPLFLQLRPDQVVLNGNEIQLETLPAQLKPQADSENRRTLIVSMSDTVNAQRLTDLLVILRPVAGIAPVILGGGADASQ